ncbi:uncharacterized protein [Venturia canescens]|uniref:uncharacterized protein isoform X1 n=1 Tax=Venturia canescens TaxID=32260 RepID=UPI001C9D57B1|nr:uncharacterized protein LOC122416114 isoform X1 [Venturia canescens]
MIADSITSCSYLLLGSGYCVYRLAKYSNDSVAKVLPQFIIASIGIVAVGARSIHALFYNLLWRSYPLNPMLIAKDLEENKNDVNLLDWILSKTAIASFVYSYYYHYKSFKIGTTVVVILSVLEILCLIEEIEATKEAKGENRQGENTRGKIAALVKNLPLPPVIFWILSSELLGRAVGNPLCRLANVPYAITVWAFPREGFYIGWSIADTINDYLMLSYLIIITEGLCQAPINH